MSDNPIIRQRYRRRLCLPQPDFPNVRYGSEVDLKAVPESGP